MVRPPANCFLLLCLWFCLLPAPTVGAKDWRAYEIGDVALEDIVTPVDLKVTNPAATEQMRSQTADQVPVVFQFDPQAGDTAVALFRASFAATKKDFLTGLEQTLSRRQVDARAVASLPFRQYLVNFLGRNNRFPADASLLIVWATGASDAAIQNRLAGKLQDVSSHYIRPDELAAEVNSGGTVRIIGAVADGGDTARPTSQELPRAQLWSLQKARTELQAGFGKDEAEAAEYLSRFLSVNCVPDVALTREARTVQTASVAAVEHYVVGDVLVQRGERITPKAYAALATLQRQLAGTRKPWVSINWAATAPAGVMVLAGLIAWLMVRRQQNAPVPVESAGSMAVTPTLTALPEATSASLALTGTPGDLVVNPQGLTAQEWQRRALAAEARAEQATRMVRTGLLSQLARFLTTDLMRKLLNQRAGLIATQNTATTEVAALAERLEKLEGPAANWREYYEHRIAELEKQMAVKDELNRQMIQTQIEAARRQMEENRPAPPRPPDADVSRPRQGWN